MNHELLNALVLACLFLALFAVAETGYHFLKVKPEWTRKLVHSGTGMVALLFPVMLHSHWSVLLLCISFFILLRLSLKFNFLKSINGVRRKSIGSLAYPVSVYGCYLVFCFFGRQYLYFYLPVLILAVSDPLAAVAGERWAVNKKGKPKESKTITGSAAFFISAYILTFVLFLLLKDDRRIPVILVYAAIVAFSATMAEAFSDHGWDNITIPASVLIGVTVLDYIM